MKDLKSLYLAAKNSGTPKDISLYTEAVKECLDKDPTNFILNLEYIITSDINLTRLDDFVEKYGISIPAYDKIVECLESCIEKCDKRNIDSSLYKEYLEKYIMFKNDHPNCFAMYEYYSDDQNDDYLSKYYSFNESGVQCRRLPMAMLDRFKVTAIPDLIITAKSFGEGAVDSMIGLLHSKTAMQFNESYNSDMILEQWISECVKDISHNSNITYNYETAESIVESMRSKHKSAYKESVILGDENICFEYSEKELRALQDLITLKEYQVVSYDNPTMAMKTQNEIYSLYEEFDGLINESGEFIKSDDLSSFTELKAAVINTRNKKTGSIPTYLSRNHDMNYGEEDDKPKSDDEHDLSDFERPSAKKSDNDKLDNIEPLGDPDENPDNEDLSSDTSPNPVNNYYYYTYNNSLNKNSNSFNKDNSTHDNHSKHDNSVTNDSSVHNSTRRITDDHSMYKRVHSHDYNGSTYDDEVESESSKPWELGSFLKNNKNQTVMMEAGNSKRPITTLFLLSSLDGKISTGSTNKRDVDADFPNISGLNNGLQQYYDIEQTTDLWSLNSGLVQSKIGVNNKPIENNPNAVVSFAVIDSKHLNEHGVRYLCGRTKKLVIITTNKNHPAKLINDEPRLSVMEVPDINNIGNIMSKLYSDYGCTRLTVQTGGTLNSLLLRNKMIDYIDLVIAPVLIGGTDTPSVVGGDSIVDAKDLNKLSVLELIDVNKLKDSYIRVKYKVINNGSINESSEYGISDDIFKYAMGIYGESVINNTYIPESSSYYMESKKNITEAVGDADDNKPQSDHPIKDVLTDVDRKLTSKQQQAKKKIQDIQNVGRAFMKPINRTKQWVDNMVSNWKDTDETKIKERMADPHARNNLISAITWSIKTGSFVKAGVLLNPLFLFLSITKHVNKNKKEFRLRNEMIGELKMELKIIDEKIKDAAAKGDTKSKYHLMRLKNEINKKLIRVGGGKGWDKML